jgi:hypothetical protein
MKYFKSLCGIGLVLLVIAYLNGSKFNNSLGCSMADDFKKESYSGIIIRKFIDQKNHRARTVLLDNGTNICLARDTSQFYEKVNVGDMLKKIKNDSSLIVNRHDKTSAFNIYFGCEH